MKELNRFSKKLLVLVLALAGYLNAAAQDEKTPLKHSDIFFLLETGIFGSTGVKNSGISTFGIGFCNYMHIQNYTGKRNSTIGIAIPMRALYSEPGTTPEDIQTMGSIAALFNAKFQLHPEKDKWWFSLGAGPEWRLLYRADNRSVFMVQMEGSLKRISDTGIFKYIEIGATSSFLPNKIMIQGVDAYSGIFVRMSIF